MSPALQVNGLTVGYGQRTVLHEISFVVAPGVTFLVGENGAGKTTLFKVVLGAVRPMAGSMAWERGNVTGAAKEDFLRGVGYLPQDFRAPTHLRVGDFLCYVGWLRLLPKAQIEGAAREALDAVGLGSRWGDRLGSLSGGMMRRVGVAQALIHKPFILLLDEPTVGLDPTARVEFRSLLTELGRSTSVLCSTHLLEDVSMVGGRMIALHRGRVAFDGATDELTRLADEARRPGMSSLETAFLSLVEDGSVA